MDETDLFKIITRSESLPTTAISDKNRKCIVRCFTLSGD